MATPTPKTKGRRTRKRPMTFKAIWDYYISREQKARTVKSKARAAVPSAIKNIKERSSYRKRASQILARKFCSCVKKVEALPVYGGPAAIGICTNAIYENKGLVRDGADFSCGTPDYNVPFRRPRYRTPARANSRKKTA